jgi:peptidoglycan-associated lipoprotein
MKRFLLLTIILVCAAIPEVSAQKRKAEKAYDSYNAGEYFDAIDKFKDAYSKTKKADKNTKAELVFMIAECYRLVNDPKNAETWYKLAVKSSYSKPDAQFWLAESMKKNGKHQQAIDEYKKYKQIAPSDARADQEIRACELAIEWMRNPEAYKVEELKEINSKEADFSPAYGRDDFGLYFFAR